MSASTRILLLDAEPTFRLLLQFRGYETTMAKSREEVRELLAHSSYNLVIVQVEYDRQSALEFCEELKQAYPSMKLALLAHHTLYFPPNTCPDGIIARQDGPVQFLQQVEQLVSA
jgi:CheY-like chemotaxis protein